MSDKELLQKILAKVSAHIEESHPVVNDPHFEVYEYSAGNIDDAFSLGIDAGYVYLSREIMEIIDGKQRT